MTFHINKAFYHISFSCGGLWEFIFQWYPKNPIPDSNGEGQSTQFSDNITLFIFIWAFIKIWSYSFIYFYCLFLYPRSVCKLSDHNNFVCLLTDIFLAPKQCLAYSCHFEKGNRMNKCVPHVESFLLLLLLLYNSVFNF